MCTPSHKSLKDDNIHKFSLCLRPKHACPILTTSKFPKLRSCPKIVTSYTLH